LSVEDQEPNSQILSSMDSMSKNDNGYATH